MDGILTKTYAEERQEKEYLKFRYKQRALVSAEMIRGYLPKEFKLVDFGAAEGLTLKEIRKLLGRGEYLGIEYNQDLVDSSQDIEIVQGDVSNLTIEGSSVDAITALALMEHLENPLKAFEEAKRILRVGGVLVATSPVPFWDKLSNKLLPRERFKNDNHKIDIDKKTFLRLCGKAGLRPIKFFYFMWSPIAFLPYLGIQVSEKVAWKIDKTISKLRIFNWMFVNQCLVAKKI